MVGFNLATTDHQYYISKKGRQGLVPLGTLESDILCIITGCSTPIVFRPVEGYYILDGEAYVQGSMAREAFKDAIDNEIKPKVFEIRWIASQNQVNDQKQRVGLCSIKGEPLLYEDLRQYKLLLPLAFRVCRPNEDARYRYRHEQGSGINPARIPRRG